VASAQGHAAVIGLLLAAGADMWRTRTSGTAARYRKQFRMAMKEQLNAASGRCLLRPGWAGTRARRGCCLRRAPTPTGGPRRRAPRGSPAPPRRAARPQPLFADSDMRKISAQVCQSHKSVSVSVWPCQCQCCGAMLHWTAVCPKFPCVYSCAYKFERSKKWNFTEIEIELSSVVRTPCPPWLLPPPCQAPPRRRHPPPCSTRPRSHPRPPWRTTTPRRRPPRRRASRAPARWA